MTEHAEQEYGALVAEPRERERLGWLGWAALAGGTADRRALSHRGAAGLAEPADASHGSHSPAAAGDRHPPGGAYPAAASRAPERGLGDPRPSLIAGAGEPLSADPCSTPCRTT